MTTFFISDLHLDESHPEISDCFLRFLHTAASQADALYILGDFFEVWIGDDNDSPLIEKVSTALKNLSTQGIKLYFMQGNRDFLLGKRFADRCGMQLLNDPTSIDLYGQKILLMHGDLLCTDDLAYQKFRRKVHQPWLQRLFLSLPLSWRQKIAKKARQKSMHYTQHKSRAIQDVNQIAVEKVCQQYGVTTLIHGHTHRPAIHTFKSEGKLITRYVLPAWHGQGGALCCDKAGKMEYVVLKS